MHAIAMIPVGPGYVSDRSGHNVSHPIHSPRSSQTRRDTDNSSSDTGDTPTWDCDLGPGFESFLEELEDHIYGTYRSARQLFVKGTVSSRDNKKVVESDTHLIDIKAGTSRGAPSSPPRLHSSTSVCIWLRPVAPQLRPLQLRHLRRQRRHLLGHRHHPARHQLEGSRPSTHNAMSSTLMQSKSLIGKSAAPSSNPLTTSPTPKASLTRSIGAAVR